MEPSMRKHLIYKRGAKKLIEDLDVLNLINSIRRLDKIVQILFTQNQQLFLSFQKQYVVDSNSDNSSSSDEDGYKLRRNLYSSKNKSLHRTQVRFRLADAIDAISEKGEFGKLDKRLLLGTVQRKVKEKQDNRSLGRLLKVVESIRKVTDKKKNFKRLSRQGYFLKDDKGIENAELSLTSRDNDEFHEPYRSTPKHMNLNYLIDEEDKKIIFKPRIETLNADNEE